MSNINMESIEPQNLYSQALTALANGQLVGARNLFSDLITSMEALPPEEIDAVLLSQAYVGLGDVEAAEKQSDAALEQYRKALDLLSSLPEELTPEFQRAALYVGQRYAESWLFDEAKEVLAQLLSKAPDNSEAHFQFGKVLIEEIGGVFARPNVNQVISEHQDQISDAIAHLEKAIDLDKNNDLYYYYLGRAYSFNQAHQAAVEAFEHAADIKPTSEYFYWLAITRKELGLYAEAVQVIDRTIELDPADFEAQHLKAELLFLLGRFAEAEQIYHKLLEDEPRNHRMRLFLGRIYYESGNFRDAIRELNSVMNQCSGEALQDALFYLGRCYSKLRQFEEARRYLERCSASGETAAILYALGCVYANQGRFENAMEKFNAALTLEPDNPDVLAQQGHLFCNMQKYEQAQEAYSQALKLNSEHAGALYGLGKLEQVVSNNIESAQSHFNRVIELAPDHALAHYSLGNLYEKQGEWEKAIAEYEAALWGDVPCPSAHRRLGVLYCQNTNKFQEALQHLEWARNMGDDSDELLFYLGLIQCRLDNYKLALMEWEKLLERHPDDKQLQDNLARIHYLMGKQHFQRKEYPPAIEHWKIYLESNKDDKHARVNLVAAYFQNGIRRLLRGESVDNDFVRKNFEEAIQLSDAEPAFRYYPGLCHLVLGELDSALQELNAFLEVTPGHRGCQYHLALVLSQTGDFSQSTDFLHQVIDGEGKDKLSLQAKMLLAYISMQEEQWVQAISLIEAALKGNLANTLQRTCSRWLAKCMIQAYGVQDAVDKIRRMIEADDQLALRYCLALIYVEQGNIDAAAIELETAIRKNGENAQLKEDLHNLLCHQAVLNSRKEDWEGAQGALKKLHLLGV